MSAAPSLQPRCCAPAFHQPASQSFASASVWWPGLKRACVRMPQALSAPHSNAVPRDHSGSCRCSLHVKCKVCRAVRYLFDRASLVLLVEDTQAQLRLLSLQEAYRLLVRPSCASLSR